MRDGEAHLSKRERQVMDILYRLEGATVAQVREAMSEAPSYSAVRAMLRILEEKGHVMHRHEGPRYRYIPIQRRDRAGFAALRRVINTYYSGSVEQVIAALVESDHVEMDPAELERLVAKLREAQRED